MSFETLDPRLTAVAGWLLTYFLHSSVLLASAWAAKLALRGRHPVLEEHLWKAAVVGGLITASIAFGPTWSWTAGEQAPLASKTTEGAAHVAEPLTELASAHSAVSLPLPATTSATEAIASEVETRGGVSWAALLLGLWLAGTALLLVRLGRSWQLLRRALTGRRRLVEGRLPALLARLTRRAELRRPVSLSSTQRLETPCALGLPHAEVCLPERAVEHLNPREQETVLAHEVAHLARRDPLWLAALALVETVLFFQPLNWVARRRLQELFEHRCDDWAVAQTGRRVEMARCLTEVASWMVDRPALPVPGMAHRGSALKRRVERLLDERHQANTGSIPRWSLAAVALALLATAALTPTLALKTEAGELPALATVEPERIAVPSTDEASDETSEYRPRRERLLAAADDLDRLAAAPTPPRVEVDRALERVAALSAAWVSEEARTLSRLDVQEAEELAILADEVRREALALQKAELVEGRAASQERALRDAYLAYQEAQAAGESDTARLEDAVAEAQRLYEKALEQRALSSEEARRAVERLQTERGAALKLSNEEARRAIQELHRRHGQNFELSNEEARRSIEELHRKHGQNLELSTEEARRAIEELQAKAELQTRLSNEKARRAVEELQASVGQHRSLSEEEARKAVEEIQRKLEHQQRLSAEETLRATETYRAAASERLKLSEEQRKKALAERQRKVKAQPQLSEEERAQLERKLRVAIAKREAEIARKLETEQQHLAKRKAEMARKLEVDRERLAKQKQEMAHRFEKERLATELRREAEVKRFQEEAQKRLETRDQARTERIDRQRALRYERVASQEAQARKLERLMAQLEDLVEAGSRGESPATDAEKAEIRKRLEAIDLQVKQMLEKLRSETP